MLILKSVYNRDSDVNFAEKHKDDEYMYGINKDVEIKLDEDANLEQAFVAFYEILKEEGFSEELVGEVEDLLYEHFEKDRKKRGVN